VFGFAEAVSIYMRSVSGMVFPTELFIALPYILTIVLTIMRKSFDTPERLGVPYSKEN
jgi:simple sugar transport system permease protein